MAIKSNMGAEYLAVKKNSMEVSPVTKDPLDKYIGWSDYRFCQETLSTGNKDASCLATFYFGNIKDALEDCGSVPVSPPLKIKATNLGYDIWFITSAQDNFDLEENYLDATTIS